MPVLIGTLATPPPTPPPPLPRPTRPAPHDPGRPAAWWIAPDGTEIELTSDGDALFTLDAVTGWGAAPISIVADPHPRGGTRVRHIQPQPRTIIWPLRFRADTHLELIDGWRFAVGKFAQTRRLGPGLLRVMRPDGSARQIRAYYQAGFDGEPEQGRTYDTAVLSLYCEDPFWQAVTPVTLPFGYDGGGPVSYLDPYLTVSLASVLGTTTATNPGNVEAWPTWTITGPATGITATNLTTGEEFTLDPNFAGGGDLLAGQTITITTDPPGVRGPAGEIWTGSLDWPGASLWALDPGINDIDLAVQGAGVGSSVTLSFLPRYETA